MNDHKVATKTTGTALLQNWKSFVPKLVVYPKCLYKTIEVQLRSYCGVLRDIKIQIAFLHAV